MDSELIEGGRRLLGLPQAHHPGLPRVSVLTVVMNRRGSMQQCMDSVFSQTYPNIEYVVVDGGSTDGTLGMLQANRERIDYFVSRPDEGIYDAINQGLSLLSGDYFLILNSDDWYAPHAVESLVREAMRTGADVVHADAWLVGRGGFVYDRLDGWLNDGLYTHRMPLRHETMLVKRSVHRRFGTYDTSYRIIADYEFLVRIHREGCTFAHVPSALLYFTMAGISNRRRDLVEDERRRFFATLFPFLEAADVDLVARGLEPLEREGLMARYAGNSELFVRSLACFARAPAPMRALKALERTPAAPLLTAARWLRRMPHLLAGNIARMRQGPRDPRRL
ncbi:MAG: glycosyltransferase family 2 protein [Luteimonas sp.]